MMMISGTAADIGGEVDISVRDNSTDLNGRQLIANARGNPVVFANLYRRHYDSVFRYCVHRLFDRQAAEDVTSAVFMKVVENLSGFRGSEKQFRNWLYKIATNAANNHLRQAARRRRILKAVGNQLDSQTRDWGQKTDDDAQKLTLLKQAMLTLRPRYQTIITLHFFENLKLTEIADVLGSSPGTVRSQLARALDILRKRMASAQRER
ncbi:MAG: RNA polymerase sigma factor [Planctomycetota bacterium]|jgi:RNA polymerase sigma-70 factor (ECF subfamily)